MILTALSHTVHIHIYCVNVAPYDLLSLPSPLNVTFDVVVRELLVFFYFKGEVEVSAQLRQESTKEIKTYSAVNKPAK